MRIFGRKEKSKPQEVNTEEIDRIQEKLNVEILGKGETSVPVTKDTTVSDIRRSLALDSSVQALDEEGRKLSDDENVAKGSGRKLNFIPNVEGGNE